MTTTSEVLRLSRTLMLHGALMLTLGLSALVWPEAMLVYALVLVGTIAALFGLYEISIPLGLRGRASHWRFALYHGFLSMVFGLLTMAVAAVDLRLAVFAAAAWLLGYSWLAIDAARVLWTAPVPRRGLMAWATMNGGLAVLALAYPEPTIFALLFLGAGYASLFGAWNLGVALWLRRALRHHAGSEHHLRLAG